MAHTKTTEVLNDLIEINNDRIKGFEKASKDLEGNDTDLKAIFDKLASDSRQNASELRSLAGSTDDQDTSVLGSLHRAWIDIKASFSGHDRKSILEECERGEDAIKKAYKSAMEDSNELDASVVSVLSRQKQAVDAGHDQIKALRDSQA